MPKNINNINNSINSFYGNPQIAVKSLGKAISIAHMNPKTHTVSIEGNFIKITRKLKNSIRTATYQIDNGNLIKLNREQLSKKQIINHNTKGYFIINDNYSDVQSKPKQPKIIFLDKIEDIIKYFRNIF